MTATTLCIGILTTTWYGTGDGGVGRLWGLFYKPQVDPLFYCLEFTGIKWIHAQLIKHSLKLQHQSKFIINGATLDLQTDKIQKETFIQRHQAFYLCVISVCFELLTGLVTLFIPVHDLQHPNRTWNRSRERQIWLHMLNSNFNPSILFEGTCPLNRTAELIVEHQDWEWSTTK